MKDVGGAVGEDAGVSAGVGDAAGAASEELAEQSGLVFWTVAVEEPDDVGIEEVMAGDGKASVGELCEEEAIGGLTVS